MVIKNRFLNAKLSAKDYPVSAVESDPNSVVAYFKIELIRKRKIKKNHVNRLETNQIKPEISDGINNEFRNIKENNPNTIDINRKQDNMKQSIMTVTEEKLTTTERKHKKRMMENLLKLISERT